MRQVSASSTVGLSFASRASPENRTTAQGSEPHWDSPPPLIHSNPTNTTSSATIGITAQAKPEPTMKNTK